MLETFFRERPYRQTAPFKPSKPELKHQTLNPSNPWRPSSMSWNLQTLSWNINLYLKPSNPWSLELKQQTLIWNIKPWAETSDPYLSTSNSELKHHTLIGNIKPWYETSNPRWASPPAPRPSELQPPTAGGPRTPAGRSPGSASAWEHSATRWWMWHHTGSTGDVKPNFVCTGCCTGVKPPSGCTGCCTGRCTGVQPTSGCTGCCTGRFSRCATGWSLYLLSYWTLYWVL